MTISTASGRDADCCRCPSVPRLDRRLSAIITVALSLLLWAAIASVGIAIMALPALMVPK